MIGGVIGLAVGLIDDDPFGSAVSPRSLRVHVILAIATSREHPFTIEKVTSPDIPRQGFSMPRFNGLKGFPCSRRDRVGAFAVVRPGSGANGSVLCRRRGRGRWRAEWSRCIEKGLARFSREGDARVKEQGRAKPKDKTCEA